MQDAGATVPMKIATLCATLAGLIAAAPLFAQETVPTDKRIEAQLDSNSQRAVEGINSFSLDLYKRSVSAEQNLFLSPASVSIAVGLAYRGARGATAEELRRTMHYDASPEAYLSGNAAILKSLNFSGQGRELRVANALWLEQGLPLRPDFLADVARHAQAGIQRVDFRNNPDAARRTINQWVAAATNNRIKDLLHEPDVTDQTRAALVNSIYWKGRWAAPFHAAGTKLEPFLGLNGERKPTWLMHQRGNFQVLDRRGVKAIQLPYAYDEVSMIVLLPDDESGLPRLEEKLTDSELKRWLGDLDAAQRRDTLATLPRMHLEWRRDLVPTLQALGTRTGFGDKADFSGMAAAPFPAEGPGAIGLKITKVIHQTYLDVDEQGSEAAAATAVLMDMIVTGARRGPPPPPPFVFRADRPFIFLLKDRRTNLILFMGRYVTPAQEQ